MGFGEGEPGDVALNLAQGSQTITIRITRGVLLGRDQSIQRLGEVRERTAGHRSTRRHGDQNGLRTGPRLQHIHPDIATPA